MIKPWGIAIIAMYVILAIVCWVNLGHTAPYATWMKVVGFNGAFVVAVDEDGEQWEITDIDRVIEGKPIVKGTDILVIMDLRFDMEHGMFAIGDSYIQNTL